jgi:hypothetical protein
MPYIGETITGNENIRKYLKHEERFGVVFAEEKLQNTEKLEVVHSSFNDPGSDWNSWCLYNNDGQKIGTITIDGY